MNQVTLVGRLAYFDRKRTSTGRLYLTGKLVTRDSGQREPGGPETEWDEWHRYVVWGATAEQMANDDPGRGSIVRLTGRFETRTFDGDQGPVTLHQISVREYEILDRVPGRGPEAQPSAGAVDHVQRWMAAKR